MLRETTSKNLWFTRTTAIGFLCLILYSNVWFLADLSGYIDQLQTVLDILICTAFLLLIIGGAGYLKKWITEQLKS